MTLSPRETLEATLPSGRTIKLKELTGHDELTASKEAGDNQGLSLFSQVMRSIIMLDGKEFDASRYTPQSTRDLFSAKDWQLVLEAFGALNRPPVEEVAAFRATFKRGAVGGEEPVGVGEGAGG
jgi:hypothetical protein